MDNGGITVVEVSNARRYFIELLKELNQPQGHGCEERE